MTKEQIAALISKTISDKLSELAAEVVKDGKSKKDTKDGNASKTQKSVTEKTEKLDGGDNNGQFNSVEFAKTIAAEIVKLQSGQEKGEKANTKDENDAGNNPLDVIVKAMKKAGNETSFVVKGSRKGEIVVEPIDDAADTKFKGVSGDETEIEDEAGLSKALDELDENSKESALAFYMNERFGKINKRLVPHK